MVIHKTQCAQISQELNGVIYICNPGNNLPSWLSPKWLCDDIHDIYGFTHVPKCMSFRKAIVVITKRTHSFHDCIYIHIYNIYIYIYIYIYCIYCIFNKKTFFIFTNISVKGYVKQPKYLWKSKMCFFIKYLL